MLSSTGLGNIRPLGKPSDHAAAPGERRLPEQETPSPRMKIVTELPRRVREIENVFIELARRLPARRARLAAGRTRRRDPVPAILEYLPYRKRDGTSQRDALTHPYFAGHGYACVRVDMRGNGEFGRPDARRVHASRSRTTRSR